MALFLAGIALSRIWTGYLLEVKSASSGRVQSPIELLSCHGSSPPNSLMVSIPDASTSGKGTRMLALKKPRAGESSSSAATYEVPPTSMLTALMVWIGVGDGTGADVPVRGV